MAEQGRVTSTDYENPYRPVPVGILNRIGSVGRNLGLTGPLRVDTLVNQARRKTGLSDFGDDGHLRALEVLVRSINDEARLTATGRFIQKSRLAAALVQRLRIENLLTTHPEIHEGLALLRAKLCAEPSIHGDKKSKCDLKAEERKLRLLNEDIKAEQSELLL